MKLKKNEIKFFSLKSNIEKIKKMMINTNQKIIQNIFNKINIFENELELQKNFCYNQIFYSNKEFDKKIKIINSEFKNRSFNIYVYKNRDTVSKNIIISKHWESTTTNNILKALKYYANKNKINNNNIYIIDVGANIGWYTFSLSKFGYKIISFEPSKINYYILKKSFCINKESNVTIINKGLSNEDKICDLFSYKGNQGNGIINCDNNLTLTNNNYIKDGKIVLTKLDNYLPFLIGKNLVLIKIDVEGSKGKVIEGGNKFITQYHIPFILMEYTPSYLKLYGTDSKKLLEIFINNGYKISPY